MPKVILKKALKGFVSLASRLIAGVDAIYLMALATGLLCGLGAGLLKLGIGWVTREIFSTFHVHSGNFTFFVLPVAGILLATVFGALIVHRQMAHGSEHVAHDMATGNVDLSPRLMVSPIIGCIFTLGLGGSAGAEGPIAYTGGAVGSNVGKVLGVDKAALGQMVGVGAAAGIGGIFMAPIGGVMFALEVLRMPQSLKWVLSLVLSSLTAALTCYIMLGCHTDVTFVPAMRFDLRLIPLVVLCGVFCGLYSMYYRKMMRLCRSGFSRISNIWVKAVVGGVVLAVLLFAFPALYGEGYNTLRLLMRGDVRTVVSYGPFYRLGIEDGWLALIMGGLLMVKPLATSATNDSGGIGGNFTPTFFAGGVAGFLFAFFLNHFMGLHLPVAIFSFFGMAGVMAGAVRAPLMAIFIAAEMTGLYGFILPLTIVALTSLTVSLVPWLVKTRLRRPAAAGDSVSPQNSGGGPDGRN